MGDYIEKRRIVQAVPVGSDRVVETRHHDAVVHEPRGISGGAVAALVLSGIALAVLVTMLIANNQQRDTDEELARERARAAEAAQQPQPSVVVVPQAQPMPVPAPATAPTPAPSEHAAAATAPTNTEVEIDVRSKLLNDPDLHSIPIEVKASGGVVTLTGQVSSEKLKLQAELLAGKAEGVRSVINKIIVEP
ncbi:MAG TPA: BON domain-containing protein [Blastocatellia bacterium]|nr:BON domain-containing protein [Blastocatellia bacterium]